MNTIRRAKKYAFLYIMILPVLLYFVIFSFYPLILGFIQSLQESRLIGQAEFTGLSNYQAVLRDSNFIQALRNSLIIGLGGLGLTLLLAVLLVLGLTEIRQKWFKQSIQTLTFLPFLFSWTVIGSLWIYMLSANGLLNDLLKLAGAQPLVILSNLKAAQPLFIISAAWKNAGYNVVILMAVVSGIDPGLYEAGLMDGASRFRQIQHITLPALRPTLLMLVLLGVTGILRNFDQAYVMQNAAILPGVRTVLLYIFTVGISQFKIGLATAAATIVLLITLGLTLLTSLLIRRIKQRWL
ncbi:MAG: ABC transporter permease subunit [Oscillospiraceae bacterium]|nr:ABC transporter permease subunit [Oscillospiraceae bacterium]MDD4368768.1 ABC transporter permease subunit [Oscillospiraceae bacterium]